MSREAFEAWAKQHHIMFVSRSHGQATTDTVSRDALTALWQAAQADAYERAVEIVRQWDADSPALDKIRALAKEAT